jgi:hypothetical protein
MFFFVTNLSVIPPKHSTYVCTSQFGTTAVRNKYRWIIKSMVWPLRQCTYSTALILWFLVHMYWKVLKNGPITFATFVGKATYYNTKTKLMMANNYKSSFSQLRSHCRWSFEDWNMPKSKWKLFTFFIACDKGLLNK